MSPAQLKRVPLTDQLLNLIGNDRAVKYDFKPAIDIFKEGRQQDLTPWLVRLRMLSQNLGHDNPPSWSLSRDLERARKRFPNGFNNLYDLTRLAQKPMGNTAFDRNSVKDDIKSIGFYLQELKNQKKNLAYLRSQEAIGDTLTYDEFLKSNPVGRTFFKGGKFNPEKWIIEDPGWASARPSVAMSYALSPTRRSGRTSDTRIHVAPTSQSRALNSGATFFTPHVSASNRRERIRNVENKNYWHNVPTDSDRYPNYEVVLPGHEMRGLPWKTYRVTGVDWSENIPVKKILNEKVSPMDLGMGFQQIDPSLEPRIARWLQANEDTRRRIKDTRDIIIAKYHPRISSYDLSYGPELKTKPELPFWERDGLQQVLEYFGGSHGE